MIKNTIIAAAALAAATFAVQPGTAEAGSKVQFHIGVGTPYYGHGYYGGHRYYGGHGSYAGPAYYGHSYYAPRPRYRVSCRRARHILRDRGFRRIRVHNCEGRRYVFTARRGGDSWIVKVSSRTGRILRARPL